MASQVVAKVVYNRLPEIAASLRPKASQIVRKAAADIEAHAKSIVPVDTGNLKNSIQTEMESDLTAVVGTNVEYAPYVELGTYKMAPRPYLGPAAERAKPCFEAAMKALFD